MRSSIILKTGSSKDHGVLGRLLECVFHICIAAILYLMQQFVFNPTKSRYYAVESLYRSDAIQENKQKSELTERNHNWIDIS